MTTAPVLSAHGLITTFHTESGPVSAVRGVDLDLNPGETLALVGESGSGKSVTAMSLLNLVRRPGRIEGGTVTFQGRNLVEMNERRLEAVRGAGIAFVPQDPGGSLNPLMKIKGQIVEAVRAHSRISEQDALERAVALMTQVGIPDPEARLGDYPLAFSGGMAQRVMIAIALAGDPEVIIADEPTTALDVTVQAQILDLLSELNRTRGTSIILITHNLGVVARVCQRVAVMYAGLIVEEGLADTIFRSPRHPYTRDLLGATPTLAGSRDIPLTAIEGRPPSMRETIIGCSYAPRCMLAEDQCRTAAPPITHDADGHGFACFVSDQHGSLPAQESRERIGSGHAHTKLGETILEVDQVVKTFNIVRPKGLLQRTHRTLSAVDNVSFNVRAGETVGLVGESGCGKSTLAKVLVGIDGATSGTIRFEGSDVTAVQSSDRKAYNRAVQLVFQNPLSSLNPRMTVGEMIAEPILNHKLAPKGAVRDRVSELLELVGLDPDVSNRYPHEFSGGQRQRIVIARALAVQPRVIVCDEAVAALDVSLQAQIINLLKDLQRRLGVAYVFIGHDLATVRHIADRILVMYLGQIIEEGSSEALTARPMHPYTAALLSAVPEPDPVIERERQRIVLAGEVPSPLDPPSACRFHTRCPIGPAYRDDREVCASVKPELRPTANGGFAACHFPGEISALKPTGLGPVIKVRRTEPTE